MQAWRCGLAAVLLSLSPAATADLLEAAVADARLKFLSDPSAALRDADAVRAFARTRQGQEREIAFATADWLSGEAFVRLHEFAKARRPIEVALARIARVAPNSKLNGDVLLALGTYDSATGDFSGALAQFQKAHNIFRTIRDDFSRARSLVYIAVLYSEALDHDNAIKYYLQARDAFSNDLTLSLAINGNLGQLYKDAHRYDEARQATLRALAIARTRQRPPLVAHVLRNLARIELFAGNLGEADRYIAEAFRLAGAADDEERAALLGVAAQAALQHGRLPQAVSLIQQSFDGVDLTRTTLPIRERHQTAYDIFTRTHQVRLALAHLAAMKRLDDQAAQLATSTSAALMGARFDFANQKLRISELQKEEAQRTLAFQIARAHTQRLIFAVGAAVALAVMALLGLGIVTLRRSRDRTRAANVELGKALAAKTEFLATTSHEIRTPLNGILGMTQVMLADRKLDGTMRDRIGVVHSAGVTMRALVDDILDVAKMQKGGITVAAAPFDLRGMLCDQVRLWEEQAKAKGLTFEVQLDDCPRTIEGDSARVRQIVFNLLSNAIKFTARGRVGLLAQTLPGSSPKCRITVSDSGIGVPAGKHEVIFEAFRQADTSTTREFGGTGLGLSICRNLARAMGGDVTLTSVPGEGAAFTLELPLVAASEPVTARSGNALVIVDGNPIARATLKALFAKRFDELILAGSTAEAIAAIEAGGVSRVLADDATLRAGGGLARELGLLRDSVEPSATEVFLLWRPADDEREAVEASRVRVIAKPIAKAALLQTVSPGTELAREPLVRRAA